ncbi:hypothetical protein MTR67_007636 [Solanum verrucosum]|uniref:Integrase zinc-binding domain-containing protein n=1 Tax=Solanum verrucosum TaxID=315347 RepID=A0AAF0Q084_SOLVR|nr:hypothetical protein MTR67_007636 [Solanum verrucosum]
MGFLYHPCKANVVVDALRRLSMGSTSHVEEGNKELAKDMHRLAQLGVKEKQDKDPIFLELKANVHKQKVMAFEKGGDGMLRYQGRLCVLKVDELQKKIMEEAYSSKYSIHPDSTKKYRDLREVYWWSSMKGHIAEFVIKCPNFKQVNVEHQRPGGVAQNIEIPK